MLSLSPETFLSQAGISSHDKSFTAGHKSECICCSGKSNKLRIFRHMQSYRLLAHSVQMHGAIHHYLNAAGLV